MNQLVEEIAAQCQCEMRQEPYGEPEKIRTTSAKIVVSGSKEKPCYEIERSQYHYEIYETREGFRIPTNVGFVKKWFDEYKHVLRKRYGYEIAGEKR